jgi:hypothetical protein
MICLPDGRRTLLMRADHGLNRGRRKGVEHLVDLCAGILKRTAALPFRGPRAPACRLWPILILFSYTESEPRATEDYFVVLRLQQLRS